MAYKRYKSRKISLGTPARRELTVVVSGKIAGALRDHGAGYLSFAYARDYDGPDVSISMPKDTPIASDLVTRPFFEGLLSDNKTTRSSMAKLAGLKRASLFDLLSVYGQDCPGAIQLCKPEDIESVLARDGRYVPVSDAEIAERLRNAADASHPVWHRIKENWSLAGNQGKFALARIDGRWMECQGAYPSTHILKPGVSDMPYQALVEFVTMQTARRSGLDVADTTFQTFDGKQALIVERYDRVRSEGSITRVHQEDFCQALGYLPNDKYQVTTAEAINLIVRTKDASAAGKFTRALFFNYLVGGIDAHAKNYSILHAPTGEIRFAPLYDLASVLPYQQIDKSTKWRHLPMSIGGETKIGVLTGSDIMRYCKKYGIRNPDAAKSNMEILANKVPTALEQVASQYADIDGIDEVMSNMLPPVKRNCEAMLANLDRTHAPSSFVKPGLAIINGGRLPRDTPDHGTVTPSTTAGHTQAKQIASGTDPDEPDGIDEAVDSVEYGSSDDEIEPEI